MRRGRPHKPIDPMEGPLAAFGALIGDRRRELGLTREQLARGLACGVTTLGDYERAVRVPRDESFVRALARTLHLAEEQVVPLWRQAHVSRAIGRRSHPFPAPLAERASEPFVGRAAELERLEHAWVSTRAGHGKTVFLLGEGGIGKSRLAAEFAIRLHADDVTVMFGRCDEAGGPYQPVHEAIERSLRGLGAEDLRSIVGRRAPDLVRLVPEFDAVLGEVHAENWGDPEAERFEMFEAAVTTLAALARTAPTLLVVEDLQWATSATMLLLRHIMRSSRRTRLLMLLVMRDAEPPSNTIVAQTLGDVGPSVSIEHLELRGLEVGEVADVVRTLIAPNADADIPALAAALQEQTDGNPYFIGEILRELSATHRDGLATPLVLPVPRSIRAAMKRRLDRFSATAHKTLVVATVVGQSVPLALLRRFPELDLHRGELVDSLDELTQARVLREPPGAVGLYVFDHELTRRCLYDDIPLARRLDLHRRVGVAMRALPTSERYADAIARHFEVAATDGDVDDALQAALDAARIAMRRLAFEDAVAVLERGLATQSHGHPVNTELVASVHLLLAEARLAARDIAGYKRAVFDAAAAARHSGSLHHLAGAAALVSTWGPFIGQPDPAAVALCEEALDRLDEREPALRARILAGLARRRALADGAGTDAEPLAREAVAVARRAADSATVAYALLALASILQGSPRVVEQLELADQIITLSEELGDVLRVTEGHHVRQRAQLELGDVTGVREGLVVLNDLAHEHGSWVAAADAAMYEGALALLEGRFEDADAATQAFGARFGEDPSYFAVYATQLMALQRERGRSADVREPLVGLIRAQPGMRAFQAALALIDADEGRLDEARETFDSLSADGFASIPRDPAWTGALACLAETCARLGDRARAETLRELIAPYSGRLAVAGWTAMCSGAQDRFLGMLEAVLGRYECAVEQFDAALALEMRVAARPLAARTRVWYARTLIARDDDGDHDRVAELLEDAFTDAVSLGMKAVAAEAETLRAARSPSAWPR